MYPMICEDSRKVNLRPLPIDDNIQLTKWRQVELIDLDVCESRKDNLATRRDENIIASTSPREKNLMKQTLRNQDREEMFSLTTHSTHFIYGYISSDIW